MLKLQFLSLIKTILQNQFHLFVFHYYFMQFRIIYVNIERIRAKYLRTTRLKPNAKVTNNTVLFPPNKLLLTYTYYKVQLLVLLVFAITK